MEDRGLATVLHHGVDELRDARLVRVLEGPVGLERHVVTAPVGHECAAVGT